MIMIGVTGRTLLCVLFKEDAGFVGRVDFSSRNELTSTTILYQSPKLTTKASRTRRRRRRESSALVLR